jgi:hypothetical protein
MKVHAVQTNKTSHLSQDLDFTAVIAPKADAAFQEWESHQAAAVAAASSSSRRPGSRAGAAAAAAATSNSLLQGPLQPFCVKAALLLWLWFDQECARMAEEVSKRGVKFSPWQGVPSPTAHPPPPTTHHPLRPTHPPDSGPRRRRPAGAGHLSAGVQPHRAAAARARRAAGGPRRHPDDV